MAGLPNILLTRPHERSLQFRDQLVEAEVLADHIHIAPVMKIVFLEPLIAFAPNDAVIFSSVAGVEAMARTAALSGRNTYCVGEKTAEAARQIGCNILQVAPDGARLLDVMSREPAQSVVHLRGEHTRGDIAAQLKGLGWKAREQVVYRQDELPFDLATIAFIQRENPLVLPLFSPRSARLLVNRLPKRGEIYGVAMSDAVREAVKDFDWTRLDVANAPDAASMVSQTLNVLKGLRI